MLRIMIAEDDPVFRRFLGRFLSQYGECDIAEDGLEAVEAYMAAMRDKKPYDMICLDVMMPKIDGVKVLKTIRDIEIQKFILPGKRAKIILTTALVEAELVRQAFEHGCDAYASKPVDTEQFAGIMKKLGLIAG
jgi:two-component system chemotaxis response regulator CheY